MYMRFHEVVVAKYNAEVEVYRIASKLELFEELFKDGVMNHVKDRLEKELALAHARLADVKVPNLDWEKLGATNVALSDLYPHLLCLKVLWL
ncbi:unnamed protein product [Eruca vesicaria subsp. sativa]|uniref:Uncharacterized protein n=1 Tax=Eruca vesicaria subsp. sativa TaxID=29727 RepID=A0ABC8KF85_ERUVS|nr:unnamed protein product [Eruca vesicaria subsp. sativa]